MTAYPLPLNARQIGGMKYVLMVHEDGRVFETLGPWIRYNSSVELRVFLS